MVKAIKGKYEKGFNPKADYCTLSPECIGKYYFNYACYLHDRQYRNEVKKRESRFVADMWLGVNIVRILWGRNKATILFSWIIGLLYFLATRLFARSSWQK
jgi:hypothetical protein